MMKQILLITDGCSNVGVSPVIAAAQAQTEGVTVNVIGVIDHGELGVLGSEEIQEIAAAGGGMSRIVNSGATFPDGTDDDAQNGHCNDSACSRQGVAKYSRIYVNWNNCRQRSAQKSFK